jgi:hypothetical protein
MSFSTTKRRLVSLASTAGVIATMAMATMPAATMAATCTPTGFVRDNIDLTAAQIGGNVTGRLDATDCNIGVYNPTSVSGATIFGADYFGVVVNGVHANVTNSSVRKIGEVPFDGTQHGRAILYINGATGTISGNQVYDFQKNGIEISGLNADGSGPSSIKTSATVKSNVVTGEGPIDYIAQNGIVIRNGASATVTYNTVSGFYYTPADTEATGLLNYQAGTIAVSGNTFARNEVNIYGDVKAIRNVHGRYATTIRPHRLRIDFYSEAQPKHTVIGSRLHWVVKVDGRTRLDMRQGFGEHDVFSRYVTPGKHRVVVYKNGVVVKNAVIKF